MESLMLELAFMFAPVIAGIAYPSRVGERAERERPVNIAIILAAVCLFVAWILLNDQAACDRVSPGLCRGQTFPLIEAIFVAVGAWTYYFGVYVVVSELFVRHWRGQEPPSAGSTFGQQSHTRPAGATLGLLGRDALAVVGVAGLIILAEALVIGLVQSRTWPLLVIAAVAVILGIKRPATALSRGELVETTIPFVLSALLGVAVWASMTGRGSSVSPQSFAMGAVVILTPMLMLWLLASVCWVERAHVRAIGASLARIFWVFVLMVIVAVATVWVIADATRRGGALSPNETARPHVSATPQSTERPTATPSPTVQVTPSPRPALTPDPDQDPYSVLAPPADCGPWRPSHLNTNLLAHGDFVATGSAGSIRHSGPRDSTSWGDGSFDESLAAGIVDDKSQRIVSIEGEMWRQFDYGDWEHAYHPDAADWIMLALFSIGPNAYVEGSISSPGGCDYTFANETGALPLISSATYSVDRQSGLPTFISLDVKDSATDLTLSFDYSTTPTVRPPIDMSAPPADCGQWDVSYVLDGLRDRAHYISTSTSVETRYLRGGKAMAVYADGTKMFRDGIEVWVFEPGFPTTHWFDTGEVLYQPVDWATQQRWPLQGEKPEGSYRRTITGKSEGKNCLYELPEGNHDDPMAPNTVFLVDHKGTLLQSSYDGTVTTFDYDTFPKISFPKDIPLRAPEG